MNVLNYPANAYLLDVDIFSRGGEMWMAHLPPAHKSAP